MCFVKTKESKVLVSKRNIKVYKIGVYVDETTFKPFFYTDFDYPVNKLVVESVVFVDSINCGLHSFLNCIIYPLDQGVIDLYTLGYLRYTMSLSLYSIFLGEFIIPKGARYCLNKHGDAVSNKLIYTGNYIEVQPGKKYIAKELWKEDQAKYLLIMVKLIKQ